MDRDEERRLRLQVTSDGAYAYERGARLKGGWGPLVAWALYLTVCVAAVCWVVGRYWS